LLDLNCEAQCELLISRGLSWRGRSLFSHLSSFPQLSCRTSSNPLYTIYTYTGDGQLTPLPSLIYKLKNWIECLVLILTGPQGGIEMPDLISHTCWNGVGTLFITELRSIDRAWSIYPAQPHFHSSHTMKEHFTLFEIKLRPSYFSESGSMADVHNIPVAKACSNCARAKAKCDGASGGKCSR